MSIWLLKVSGGSVDDYAGVGGCQGARNCADRFGVRTVSVSSSPSRTLSAPLGWSILQPSGEIEAGVGGGRSRRIGLFASTSAVKG
jgi:hypothetical protein